MLHTTSSYPNNSRRWLTENCQNTEDDLPWPGQFRLTTSRNWTGPGQLAKSEKRIWWHQLSKVIFRGQAIPTCDKPEVLIWFSGDRKITDSDFGWTKSSQKSLSRTKNDFILLSWDCMIKNLPPVWYSGSNEPSLAPPVQMPGQYLYVGNTSRTKTKQKISAYIDETCEL